MVDTARLDLPLIAAEQALKHVTHNEAMQALDSVVQLSVMALDATTPPAAPQLGDCYGLGTGASGDWSGHDGEIATWTGGGWRFATPGEGWLAWNGTAGTVVVFVAGHWTALSTTIKDLQNLALVGVNATADAVNKLAVRANAALFNALESGAGGTGDVRLTLNRETVSDTASLVFQSAWSGRAEIGLVGTDDFSFKVSADGTNFNTALTLDSNTGFVALNTLFGSPPSFPAAVSGVLTVSSSYAVPTPETGNTDTIDTVSGGFDGALLVVTGTAGNALTFADGTGNLKLGADRVLDNFGDALVLVKRGADWIELSFADNG